MDVGIHLVEVLYDDAPVPKSPFRVSVVEGCDPTRVRAYGPGLEGGITNKSNSFTVETRYLGIPFKSDIADLEFVNNVINLWLFLSGAQVQEASA